MLGRKKSIDINSEIKGLAGVYTNQSRILTVMATIVSTVLLALLFLAVELGKISLWVFFISVLVIVAFQIFHFVVVDYKSTEQAPQLLQRHIELGQELEENRAHLDALEGVFTRLQAGYALAQMWSNLQSAADKYKLADLEALESAVSEFCEPMIQLFDEAFLYNFNTRWSFVVYGYYGAAKELRPVWCERSRDHPASGKSPRNLVPGEGHVGTAFLSREMVFTTNAEDANGKVMTATKQDNRHEYDADVYRSFISVPIFSGSKINDEPAGVIVLTNDADDCFDAFSAQFADNLATALGQIFARVKLDNLTPSV